MIDQPHSPEAVDRVGIVGAGLMGHGIALSFAASGRTVTLYDADEDTLAESLSRIRSGAETLARHDRVNDPENVVERVTTCRSIATTVEGADFVTEAVAEDLEIKRAVFRELDEHAPAQSVLATNTSGLSITSIAEAVSTPARVVGTHWFNPPYIVPLVEVVRGGKTADAVMDATYDLMATIEKTPVRVEKDITGFIGNRIQLAMTYEAFSLLDAGVASAEDIDRAVKAGFGFRLPALGVFEKVDHSGLEVHHAIESYLMPELDRGTDPNPILSELIEQGRTGVRSGQGVYEYSDVDPETVYQKRDEALLSYLDTYDQTTDD